MTRRLEPGPGLRLPAEPADRLAAELARAVVTRLESTTPQLETLASSMSLDAGRLRVELAYLLVAISEFCISSGVSDPGGQARLVSAFASATLATDALQVTPRGLRGRLREYRDALAHPHPELGRAYSVGRTFARCCDASHEVAVIEFAARTYMAQLPPMLAWLRSVSVGDP